MVYLTGDTHGDLDRFRHGRLRWLGKRDIVVVLGDFGFVWDGSAEEQKKLDWLRKRPYTLLFLDGAHENYDLLAQYPVEERFGGRVQALGGNVYHVCRGSVLELENKKYLWGLLAGMCYFAVLFLLTLILRRNIDPSSIQTITTACLCMGGGMLGGMLAF